MKSARKTRRTVVALALSTTFHVVILTLLVSQAAPEYQLPESIPPAPPMDVRIMPEPPPPVFIQPLPQPEPPKPQPPKPQPPKPKPPEPAPAAPAPTPPTPAPAKPAPVAPKPAPAQPAVIKPLPAPPAPVAPPTPAPTTTRAPTPPAPPAPSAPVHLNIHKPEKEAPGNVATLPFAPAPTPSSAPSAGVPAAPSGEPPLGGSRLNGLTPYPYGSMPSGGSGLRGTLVGCANADSVNLSSAERARCNERFGSRAASAPALDPISPTKRAAFDKAAERQDRSLRYLDSIPAPGAPIGALSPDGTSRGPSSVISSAPPH